jgi:hypothetical protein
MRFQTIAAMDTSNTSFMKSTEVRCSALAWRRWPCLRWTRAGATVHLAVERMES